LLKSEIRRHRRHGFLSLVRLLSFAVLLAFPSGLVVVVGYLIFCESVTPIVVWICSRISLATADVFGHRLVSVLIFYVCVVCLFFFYFFVFVFQCLLALVGLLAGLGCARVDWSLWGCVVIANDVFTLGYS